MRVTIVYLLFIIFLKNPILAQDKDLSELRKLDSIAFSSLENNSPNAQFDAENLLKESLKVKPSFYRVNAYTILGILNKNRGFYISALDLYLKALNAADIIRDNPRKSACFNNIGMIYQLQEKYEQAIHYFNLSLELEKKLNQPLQQSIRYYNIGESYKELDSLDLALTYFNNSLIIEQKAKNLEGIIFAELGICDIYIKIKRLTEADLMLQKIQGQIKPSYIEENIIFNKLKAAFLIAEGNYTAAYPYLNNGEALAKKYDFQTYLLSIYKLQIALLKSQDNWKGASDKYEQYVKLNDELNSIHVRNQVDDLTFRNEMTKKELEIELVQEERDLARSNESYEKKLRLYSQKIIWFVIILLGVFITLIVLGIKKLTSSKNG